MDWSSQIFLVAGIAGLLAWVGPAQAQRAGRFEGRRIAVLEFKVAETARISSGETLTDEARGAVVQFTRADGMLVLTRENMMEVLRSTGGECKEGECEVETARNLGVDYFLAGSALEIEGRLVLVLKVYETRTGGMLASKRLQSTGEFELLERTAPATLALLGSALGSPSDQVQPEPGTPTVRIAERPSPPASESAERPALLRAPRQTMDEQALGRKSHPPVSETGSESRARGERAWGFRLVPAWTQVNGSYTRHWGSAAGLDLAIGRSFLVRATAVYAWYTASTAMDLVEATRTLPMPSDTFLLQWAALGGAEWIPFRWERSEGKLGVSLGLSAAIGAGGTRTFLRGSGSETVYGSTGIRPVGQVGVAGYLMLTDTVSISLSLQDNFFSSSSPSVNGCSLADLASLKAKGDSGATISSASVGSTCDVGAFGQYGGNPRADVALAMDVVTATTAEIVHNVGIFAGVALTLF